MVSSGGIAKGRELVQRTEEDEGVIGDRSGEVLSAGSKADSGEILGTEDRKTVAGHKGFRGCFKGWSDRE
jgi:hypothetical protein